MSTRYPFTGPNYAQHGEVPGYLYYPWNDQYYIDPQQVQAYNESVGLAEPVPEEPSLFDTLLPVAGTAAALAGGTALGNRLTSGDWPSWLGGGSAAPVSQEIALGGSNAAGGAVAAGGQLGGGAGSAPNILGISRQPMAAESGGMINQAGNFISANPLIGGALGGIGLGLGAKGVYDAYESGDLLSGGISGAGAGLGASMLSGAMGGASFGPVGMIGGGLLGLGAAALGGRKTGEQLIQERINSVEDQGVNIPQPLLDEYATYGLSQDDLVAREQAKIAAGQHGNAVFAQTRDVKDLTPQDTVGGLMWLETLGNEYLQGMTPEQRIALNDAALKEGLITEGGGQLNLTNQERVKQLAQAAKSGRQGTSNPTPLGMLGDANRMQVTQGPQMPAMLGGLQINPINQPQGMIPQQRTNTLSPGIGLDGRPIRY